ncbi:hypothetical protein [Bradyrhizobium sp.]|uniref:hypothetical protein n=1 Tax=Bradyrhizobium sp. TaxID=376 RepID=UPI003C7913CD
MSVGKHKGPTVSKRLFDSATLGGKVLSLKISYRHLNQVSQMAGTAPRSLAFVDEEPQKPGARGKCGLSQWQP